jgi:phage shock protein PspC (stress-responsive transcriptional regulator)
MADPIPLFKFSHAGEVIQEGLPLAEAVKLIAEKTILPNDHYWTDGMSEWKLVSSRIWANPPDAVKVAAPQPVLHKPMPTPSYTAAAASFQPKPAPAALPSALKPSSVSASTVVDAPEKGFSPYVTFYRSNDNRWAYGIFGGLAHRNSWPSSVLVTTRILTLIFVFPALAYLVGWGLVTMLLTPSLPTAKVRSYYDLNKGMPSQDSQDLGRLVKILIGGFLLLVAISFLSKFLVGIFRS